MRRYSMLNTTSTPKMIEFGRRMGTKDPVWWLGSMPDLSDGLGSRNRVLKESPLFCWQRGEIESEELSRCHPCWCIVTLGTKALLKTSLVVPAGLCTIPWGQIDSGVAVRECSPLHYQRWMAPIVTRSQSYGFWDLVIPWEQGLDRSPSQFGRPKGQTAEGVGQNPAECHSWLVQGFL